MALPKPSAQTQLLLTAMDDKAHRDACWAQVTESLDLLFAKVAGVDNHQSKLEA